MSDPLDRNAAVYLASMLAGYQTPEGRSSVNRAERLAQAFTVGMRAVELAFGALDQVSPVPIDYARVAEVLARIVRDNIESGVIQTDRLIEPGE